MSGHADESPPLGVPEVGELARVAEAEGLSLAHRPGRFLLDGAPDGRLRAFPYGRSGPAAAARMALRTIDACRTAGIIGARP